MFAREANEEAYFYLADKPLTNLSILFLL